MRTPAAPDRTTAAPTAAVRDARSAGAATITAVALVVLSATSGAGPAAAVDDGFCPGVLVVVDASDTTGQISSTCVEEPVTDGLDALDRAGHEVGFVPGNPGMVCTIDGAPDPCNRAPADAYWSYWHGDRDEVADDRWTYATVGAGNRTPQPGTVEGWRFGDGSDPPAGPPAAAAATTASPDGADPGPTPSGPSPAAPTGALVGVGLLTGIGALTVGQRLRRRRGAP